MCGIVGILGKDNVAETILESLRRLEYRGYDSAGIATIVNGGIERRRAEGKLSNLSKELSQHPLPGIVGIGHTRWATHGAPTVGNAHPHATDRSLSRQTTSPRSPACMEAARPWIRFDSLKPFPHSALISCSFCCSLSGWPIAPLHLLPAG